MALLPIRVTGFPIPNTAFFVQKKLKSQLKIVNLCGRTPSIFTFFSRSSAKTRRCSNCVPAFSSPRKRPEFLRLVPEFEKNKVEALVVALVADVPVQKLLQRLFE